ncbi:hypothetical protein Ct61P_15506 [Colletotrichum tofieldiae]|nr:hypothetical protein Ct61P_15506 [Colletotrichum tofieldiae]
MSCTPPATGADEEMGTAPVPPEEDAEIAKRDELLLKLTKAILSHKPVSTISRAFASGGEGSVGGSDADQAALALLVKDCEPATFGRDDEEVFDEGHRKVGKMDTEAFCADFFPYEYSVMETVSTKPAR